MQSGPKGTPNHKQRHSAGSKDELQPKSPGIRVLCPTRWTVHADSLKSVLDNYTVLQELWEEVEKYQKIQMLQLESLA